MKNLITTLFFALSGHLFSECAFCNAKIIAQQKYCEDEYVMVLYTHKPVLRGHSLVIPKRHVERFEDLNENELLSLHKMVKTINHAAKTLFQTRAYLVFQKTGADAGQSVPHAHLHFIPMAQGDSSTISFMTKMFLSEMSSPISQKKMNEMITHYQSALPGEYHEVAY